MRTTWMQIGGLLIALGIGLWLAAGRTPTALIPAFFGVVLVGLAMASGKGANPGPAGIVALVLALLGAAGGFAMGLPKVMKQLGGGELEKPLAAWGQVAMGVLCLFGLLDWWSTKRRR